MVKRSIVEIDEDKCTGCGQCIPNCHEGALKIVNGKAKLVKATYCDGLGNCLGHCPFDAIRIVEKDVDAFDFEATNTHLRSIGREELKENPLDVVEKKEITTPPSPCSGGGCPGARLRQMQTVEEKETLSSENMSSSLRQWPVQMNLLPPNAPFFNNSDLLICADCVAVAFPNLHQQLLKGKSVAIGCPKLDNLEAYIEKIKAIIQLNDLKSITVAVMEVPCCQGMYMAVSKALAESEKNVPLIKKIISINGEFLN